MAVRLTYHGTPYYDQIMQQNAFKQVNLQVVSV